VCNWQGLVIAGLADYARPAEKLSVGQSTALAATGLLFHENYYYFFILSYYLALAIWHVSFGRQTWIFHFASSSFATEFSQELAYSSAEWSLGRQPSRLNSGRKSTMWAIFWGWPHLHRSDPIWTSLHGNVAGLSESGSAKTRTDEIDRNPDDKLDDKLPLLSIWSVIIGDRIFYCLFLCEEAA